MSGVSGRSEMKNGSCMKSEDCGSCMLRLTNVVRVKGTCS